MYDISTWFFGSLYTISSQVEIDEFNINGTKSRIKNSNNVQYFNFFAKEVAKEVFLNLKFE